MNTNYIPIPLINESLLKLHSPITSNVDIADFLPYISIAQELYVEPILGEPLMAELKEQVETNTLTGANSSLIVRIAPVLSFYTVYQALPFHWAAIVNKGITIRESENSKGVDIGDISQLRRWIKDDAEVFAKLLVRFLCNCRSAYPLWKPAEGCCGEVLNEGSAATHFESGFYFPSRNKGCGCD